MTHLTFYNDFYPTQVQAYLDKLLPFAFSACLRDIFCLCSEAIFWRSLCAILKPFTTKNVLITASSTLSELDVSTDALVQMSSQQSFAGTASMILSIMVSLARDCADKLLSLEIMQSISKINLKKSLVGYFSPPRSSFVVHEVCSASGHYVWRDDTRSLLMSGKSLTLRIT